MTEAALEDAFAEYQRRQGQRASAARRKRRRLGQATELDGTGSASEDDDALAAGDGGGFAEAPASEDDEVLLCPSAALCQHLPRALHATLPVSPQLSFHNEPTNVHKFSDESHTHVPTLKSAESVAWLAGLRCRAFGEGNCADAHEHAAQQEGDGLLVKLDEQRAGRPPTSAAVAAQWFAQDLFDGAEDDDQEAEDDLRSPRGKLASGQPGADVPNSVHDPELRARLSAKPACHRLTQFMNYTHLAYLGASAA